MDYIKNICKENNFDINAELNINMENIHILENKKNIQIQKQLGDSQVLLAEKPKRQSLQTQLLS